MTYVADEYLTDDRLSKTYQKCARAPGGVATLNVARVESWLRTHTFDIPSVGRAREDIIRMLLCIPAGFRSDTKGGGSVLDVARRGSGVFWTGSHTDVDDLIALGMATGLVTFCVPREHWHKLPGKLPYVRVEITQTGARIN